VLPGLDFPPYWNTYLESRELWLPLAVRRTADDISAPQPRDSATTSAGVIEGIADQGQRPKADADRQLQSRQAAVEGDAPAEGVAGAAAAVVVVMAMVLAVMGMLVVVVAVNWRSVVVVVVMDAHGLRSPAGPPGRWRSSPPFPVGCGHGA